MAGSSGGKRGPSHSPMNRLSINVFAMPGSITIPDLIERDDFDKVLGLALDQFKEPLNHYRPGTSGVSIDHMA